ncbi:hypothetical protein FACS1894218_0890 [Bacilli bacterium]|nr:hypothetical protein FACS1894218_0890 [Bacilli bacterium]
MDRPITRIKLSARLASVAKLIKNGNIIDVGSDHAYLSCFLLTNHLIRFAYNIDINELPLKRGVDNVRKCKVGSHCKNILADGLQTTQINKVIDYCVIAGMGGKNIVDIIKQKNPNIKINNFILVPNNNAKLVRQFLAKHQYRISYEEIIQDHDYFYELIVASKTRGLFIKNVASIYFGPYNLLYPSPSFQEMLRVRKAFIEREQLHIKNQNYAREWKLLKGIK